MIGDGVWRRNASIRKINLRGVGGGILLERVIICDCLDKRTELKRETRDWAHRHEKLLSVYLLVRFHE